MIYLKHFAKEIGALEEIITNNAHEDKSQEEKKCINSIGTMLTSLEEVTRWANRVELYFELLKETVRKDMKEVDSLLEFWDYFI